MTDTQMYHYMCGGRVRKSYIYTCYVYIIYIYAEREREREMLRLNSGELEGAE